MTTKNSFYSLVLTDKEHNNLLILDIVRKNGPISRTDISKMTGFNIVTTSNYINHYLEIGLAVETELDASTGGRKPILVSLNRKAGYAAGLSLGQGCLRGMVADLECRAIREKEKGLKGLSPDNAAESLAQFAEELFAETKIEKAKVRGLALALPGVIDPQGRWFPARGIVGEKDTGPITLDLEKRLGIPVILENSVNAAVLAEKWLGLNSEVQHVIYLSPEPGCGILIDGEIYRGASGSAGQLENGAADPLAGLDFPEAVRERIRGGEKSTLAMLIADPEHGITFEAVGRAAKEGDALAKAIVAKGGEHLGRKVQVLAELFDPEVIVVGGGLEKCGAIFLDGVKSYVKENLTQKTASPIKVIPSAFGEKASLWGAASIVAREVFRSA